MTFPPFMRVPVSDFELFSAAPPKRRPLALLDSNVTKDTVQCITAALKPTKSDIKSSEIHAEAIVSLLNSHHSSEAPPATKLLSQPHAAEPDASALSRVKSVLELGPTRQAVASLSSMLAASSENQVREVLGAQPVVKFLVEAIGSDDAQVRKGAVFCLVDLKLALGDAASSLMDGLPESQKKLVNLYVQRRDPQNRVSVNL
jgi:hypothetical protein